MKRYGCVLVFLVVLSTGMGNALALEGDISIGPWNPVPIWGPPLGTREWFQWKWDQDFVIPLNPILPLHPVMPGPMPTPGLPQIQPAAPTATEVSLTIAPSEPTEFDQVSVTVSCWTNAMGYYVESADLRTSGRLITLDLYWEGDVVGWASGENHHVQPLGTLSPGTYILTVRNRGALGGFASTSFTVGNGIGSA